MGGTVRDPESFGGLSASWALSLRARNRSEKTVYSYLLSARMLEEFLVKAGMPTDVRDLRREHIEAFIADQLSRGKPNTAGLRYRSVKQLFRWLLEEDEIDEDPMAKMSAPSVPEAPVPVVSDDDLNRLICACEGRTFEDRRDLAIIRLFIATPSRLAEVTGHPRRPAPEGGLRPGDGQGEPRAHRTHRPSRRPGDRPLLCASGRRTAGPTSRTCGWAGKAR